MKRFYVLFPFLFFVPFLLANHYMGSHMMYQYLGNKKYKIISKVYRDCRGNAFSSSNPSFGVFAGTNNSNGCGSSTISFTRTAIRDVTPICSTATKPCSPSNTSASGDGLEEHTYEATVDFGVTPLSNFVNKSSCCEVTFYTMFAGSCSGSTCTDDHFSFVTINICNIQKTAYHNGFNNSTLLTGLPKLFACCNQAYYFSPGLLDTLDHDSMTCQLVPTICSLPNTSCYYSSPFSYKYPFTPYCIPTGTVKCTPNPGADPPKGFYFDTITGDIVFTPTQCTEVAFVDFEVREYRKDSSNNWIWIGTSHPSFQIVVRDDCGYNKAPIISANFINKVCAGDKICFNIKTTDATFSPYQTVPDTLKLTWNSGIPGGVFKIKDTTAKEKEAEFCWQTNNTDASEVSSRFSVVVTDQHCGKTAVSSRGFLVRVYPRSKGKLNISKGPCGSLYLDCTKDSNFYGAATYQWELKDSYGGLLFTSNKKSDTITYIKKGVYFVSLRLNGPGNCPNSYYDTLFMPELPKVALGKDTFACDRSNFVVAPQSIHFATSPYKYEWTRRYNPTVFDTNATTTINLFAHDTGVILRVTDSNHCVFRDTILIQWKPLPIVNAGADKYVCSYDSVVFDAQHADTVDYLWSDGSVTEKIWAHLPGYYTLRVTERDYHCSAYDTVKLTVNDTVKAFAGHDTFVCTGSIVSLFGDNVPKQYTTKYNWEYLNKNQYYGSVQDINFLAENNAGDGMPAKTHQFEWTVTVMQNGIFCKAKDTISIMANSKPGVGWKSNLVLSQCHNYGDIVVSEFIVRPAANLWDSSNLKITSFRKYFNGKPLIASGRYSYVYLTNNIDNGALQNGNDFVDTLTLFFTDTNGCSNSSIARIRILGNPLVELKSKSICQQLDSVALESLVASPTVQSRLKRNWEAISWPPGANINTQFIRSKDRNILYFGGINDTLLSGKYSFSMLVQDTITGCIGVDTVDVKIIPHPMMSYIGPTSVCSSDPDLDLITLTRINGMKTSSAITKISPYSFNGFTNYSGLHDTSIFNGTNFRLSKAVGNWKFLFISNNQGCERTEAVGITVRTWPVAKFRTDPDSVAQTASPNFQVTNESYIQDSTSLHYNWYFGTGISSDTSSQSSPFIKYPQKPGTYNLKLIVHASNGCVDTFVKKLTVQGPVIGVVPIHILSGLFVDDHFVFHFDKYKFQNFIIYDVSGRMVAEDSRNAGVYLPPGIYFYLLKVQIGPGEYGYFTGKKILYE